MAELPPWVGFNHLHLKKKKEHRDWVCVSLLMLEKVPGDVAYSVPPPTTTPRPRPRPDQPAQPGSQGSSSKLARSRWGRPPACRAQEVHHFHPVAARRLLLPHPPLPAPAPRCQRRVSAANQQEIEWSAERVRKKPILSQTRAVFPPWSSASKGSCFTGRVFDQIRFARLK